MERSPTPSRTNNPSVCVYARTLAMMLLWGPKEVFYQHGEDILAALHFPSQQQQLHSLSFHFRADSQSKAAFDLPLQWMKERQTGVSVEEVCLRLESFFKLLFAPTSWFYPFIVGRLRLNMTVMWPVPHSTRRCTSLSRTWLSNWTQWCATKQTNEKGKLWFCSCLLQV